MDHESKINNYTIQYNTIQYNTIQYNTIQYNKFWQHLTCCAACRPTSDGVSDNRSI